MNIVFTGGGTAGHVTPNIALMNKLSSHTLHYIGTNGVEKSLIENSKIDVRYHPIEAVKLVRKFTVKNLTIPFRLGKSIAECKKILQSLNADVVFSKGGFVGLPVVIASRQLKIPTLIHESDVSMGLANKISAMFASKVLSAFPCHKKATVVGNLLREEIGRGNAQKGLRTMGFDGKKPVLLVLGGSLGAGQINKLIQQSVNLRNRFDVFVITGKGKKISGDIAQAQFAKNVADLYAASTLAITRCGSTTLCELIQANLPFVGIPLEKFSRGEQVKNGLHFQNQGCGIVLSNPSVEQLESAVNGIYDNLQYYKERQSRTKVNGCDLVAKLILSYGKKQ